MKTSNFLISTQKEIPNDAQIISHKLMIRAGLISKLASGLYTWLPLGLKILKKIEDIVRDEMNKSGALEILMPMVQPAELWQQSKRWDKYGLELLRLKDRHDREFCLGPTHEEIITNLASQYIKSYKQLPLNLYQIQTKFRDEIRPRFGVMRAREFLMKDAYSFHINEKSLDETYQIMFQTYCNIFDKIGLDYRPVMADSGAIGGNSSHEFHVLADSGEDAIAFSDSDKSDYAANIEQASIKLKNEPKEAQEELKIIDTPNIKTIEEISNFLQIKTKKIIKTIIVEGENSLVAIALRGDRELNEIKAEKHALIKSPLTFATDEKIKKILDCEVGSLGVVDLKIPLIVDYSAYESNDFVCGANQTDKHLTGVNWHRDVKNFETMDCRNIVKGDSSPDGKGKIIIKRGIEVGHIFKLGNQYADTLGANVIDESGKAKTLEMGCYGIGVSRVLAATIEQNYDDNGIIFPESIAPFQVIIVPINYHKSTRVKQLSDDLYKNLTATGCDVLLDDRKERPGIMFKDSELIGIPHRLVLSDTHADNGTVEYKARNSDEKLEIAYDEVIDFIQSK
ncbi:Prolyl-tRNA synthetase, bacterial type [hydrothermal vent metagenome]|uniref:proline--tRNA ligase n=1 Tax=hydrothermal vent metagenome TaxID=652676 RepID=A0A1W1BZZ6_9ZZZZ